MWFYAQNTLCVFFIENVSRVKICGISLLPINFFISTDWISVRFPYWTATVYRADQVISKWINYPFELLPRSIINLNSAGTAGRISFPRDPQKPRWLWWDVPSRTQPQRGVLVYRSTASTHTHTHTVDRPLRTRLLSLRANRRISRWAIFEIWRCKINVARAHAIDKMRCDDHYTLCAAINT